MLSNSEIMKLASETLGISFDGVELTAEEPACCQQLYSILDGIVQKVITDKDVNIDAIIEEAVKDFQTNHLDNM